MAAENTSELICRLIDDVTGPSRAAGMAIKGLTDDIRRSTLQFESLGRQAHRNFENAKTSLVGSAMAAGAFAAAMYEPIKKSIELAETMKPLEIATGRTGEQMEELSKTFSTVARDVHKTTQEIAAAAGALPREIQKNTEATTKLLTAGGRYATQWGEDFSATVGMATQLTKNFGLGVDDVVKSFDSFEIAKMKFNFPAGEMAAGLHSLVTDAKELGYSGVSGLNSVLATLTAIARITGNASEAFTEFHKVAMKLSYPAFKKTYRQRTGSDVDLVMREARARGEDPMMSGAKSMQKTIDQRASMYGEQKRAEDMIAFFGEKGDRSLQDFLTASKSRDEIFKQMYNSQGALDRGYLKFLDDWSLSFKDLGRSFIEINKTFGNVVGPKLLPFVNIITEIVRDTEAWIKTNDKLVWDFTLAGGALAGFALTIGTAKTAIFGINLAMGVLALNPVFVAMAGLAASLAAIAMIAKDPKKSLLDLFGGSGGRAAERYFWKGGTGDQLGNAGGWLWDKLFHRESYAGPVAAHGGMHNISGNFADIAGAGGGVPSLIDKVIEGNNTARIISETLMRILYGEGGAARGIGGFGGGGATPSSGGGGATPAGGAGGGGTGSGGGGRSARRQSFGHPGGGDASKGAAGDPATIAAIRKEATEAGVNPDLMEAIYHGEGAAAYVGDKGSSFGPFQLHMGGLAGGGNAGAGMGDEFKKETGLDPRDPKTVPQQIAWVAKRLKAHPEQISQFHGYKHGAAYMASRGGKTPGAGDSGTTGSGTFSFMHGQFGAHGDMTHIHEYTTGSGRKVKLNDETAKHMIPFLNEMEKMGMPYTRRGDYDSFNDRPIRGSSTWSQHAYANAVDLEATGFNPTPAMTAWQNAHMGEMRAAMGRHGIKWGGDMRRQDRPHFEWGGGAEQPAQMAQRGEHPISGAMSDIGGLRERSAITQMGRERAESATSGAQRLQTALGNIHGKPHVDDEHIDDALRKLERMRSLLHTMERPGFSIGGGDGHDAFHAKHRLNSRWRGGQIQGT